MHSPRASDGDLRAYLAQRGVPCPACGYNLRGLAEGECPECGFGFDLPSLKRLRREALLAPLPTWRNSWLFLLAANGILFLVFFTQAGRHEALLGLPPGVFYLVLHLLLVVPWRFREAIEQSLLDDSDGRWLLWWGRGLTALHAMAVLVWGFRV